MRDHIGFAAVLLLLCASAVEASNCSFTNEEIMTAISNPPEGREKEYHDFFDKVHLPEIVSRGIGFEGAQRFRVIASVGSAPWSYLSVYALEPNNTIAETGMKFRPGAAPVVAPAPYLAPGSVAWIFRRTTRNNPECVGRQKLFVVLPQATAPELDLTKTLSAVAGLVSAERYEFRKSTKGDPPAWKAMSVFRASDTVDVPATLRRLGSWVGCDGDKCPVSSGAVWVLEPLANYVARPE
jgi:hypothetical protein